MKQMTDDEIVSNWNTFMSLIEKHFTGERKSKIIKMAEFFQDRMMFAPASYKEHYHSAYPGGYLQHVLNVYSISMDMSKMWDVYTKFKDYTDDEVAFIALFHDLGKIGDEKNEFYQPQDNEWRRNNLSEIYKINKELSNMNGADRSLYLLQHFGIELSQNEWIAIKIHEGMYEEANETYLKTSYESSIIKSHLPHLIHHADMMATRVEYEQWKNIYDKEDLSQGIKKQKYTPKKNLQKTIAESLDKTESKEFNFDDLFEDSTNKEK